jgi:hypothetical protein
MVAELAQAWGVERDGVGKAVWCEFRIATASGSGTARATAEAHGGPPDDELDADALLALYADDEDGGVPRPGLSTCRRQRGELVVRVVA